MAILHFSLEKSTSCQEIILSETVFPNDQITLIIKSEDVGVTPVITGTKPQSDCIAPSTCYAAGYIDGDFTPPVDMGDLTYLTGVLDCYRDDVCLLDMYQVDFNGDCIIDSDDMDILTCALFGAQDWADCGVPVYPVPTCCNPVIVPFNTSLGSIACCVGATLGYMDSDPSGPVDMGDLTLLIDMLFLTLNPVACLEEADVDLSGWPCTETNDVDMGDLTVLIDFLFLSLTPLPECP